MNCFSFLGLHSYNLVNAGWISNYRANVKYKQGDFTPSESYNYVSGGNSYMAGPTIKQFRKKEITWRSKYLSVAVPVIVVVISRNRDTFVYYRLDDYK